MSDGTVCEQRFDMYAEPTGKCGICNQPIEKHGSAHAWPNNLDSIRAQIDFMKKDRDYHRSSALNQSTYWREHFETQIKELGKDMDVIAAENHTQLKKLDALQSTLASQSEALSQLREEAKASDAEILSLRNELAEAREKLKADHEFGYSARHVATLESQLVEARAESVKFKTLAQQYEEQLRSYNYNGEKVHELQSQLASLRKQAEIDKGVIELRYIPIRHMNEQNEQLRAEVASLRKSLDSKGEACKCPNCGSAYAHLARCACGRMPRAAIATEVKP